MPIDRRRVQGRFFRRFKRSTRAVLTSGNSTRLIFEPSQLFARLFDAIESAESFICLEFYIIHADNTGRELAQRLASAVKRGVSVYLIYDYVGCFDTPSYYFRQLSKAGVKCSSFNRPSIKRGFGWLDKRDHRKLCIIDGVKAFSGGFNIGDEYSGIGGHTPWRDICIEIEGNAVYSLTSLFCQIWFSETAELLNLRHEKPAASGNEEIYIVAGGPHHNRSYIRSSYRMAIAGSFERIVIATPYFIPGPRILRSLIRAVKRGVDVSIILPAVCDVPIVRLASRVSYSILLKTGVRIFEREGTTLHAKVMRIDNSWTLAGSANLDQRSFHRNFEINFIVTGNEFGEQVDRMLENELSASVRITEESHSKRGTLVTIIEKLLSVFSWFL